MKNYITTVYRLELYLQGERRGESEYTNLGSCQRKARNHCVVGHSGYPESWKPEAKIFKIVREIQETEEEIQY